MRSDTGTKAPRPDAGHSEQTSSKRNRKQSEKIIKTKKEIPGKVSQRPIKANKEGLRCARKAHMRRRPVRDTLVDCPKCSTAYPLGFEMAKHMFHAHNCPVCFKCKKTFKNPLGMSNHWTNGFKCEQSEPDATIIKPSLTPAANVSNTVDDEDETEQAQDELIIDDFDLMDSIGRDPQVEHGQYQCGSCHELFLNPSTLAEHEKMCCTESSILNAVIEDM